MRYLRFHVSVMSCSAVVSTSVRPNGLQPTRLLSPWDFPGKNTGVGCHFLLQGIFPTQGSNPGLLHCRQTLYPLGHQGSLKYLKQTKIYTESYEDPCSQYRPYEPHHRSFCDLGKVSTLLNFYSHVCSDTWFFTYECITK